MRGGGGGRAALLPEVPRAADQGSGAPADRAGHRASSAGNSGGRAASGRADGKRAQCARELTPEASRSQPLPQDKLIWRPALGSALVAGMLAAVGTSIPIIPLAMLCMFASGGLAVTLYRRRAGLSQR